MLYNVIILTLFTPLSNVLIEFIFNPARKANSSLKKRLIFASIIALSFGINSVLACENVITGERNLHSNLIQNTNVIATHSLTMTDDVSSLTKGGGFVPIELQRHSEALAEESGL